MRRNYIREKKILCGDSYMAVGLYAITPQEHKARGKKQKESSTDQKSRNKMSSLRQKQRKAIANFDKYGFFLTGTFEEAFLPDDILACKREVVNYKRRVIAATCKRFGVSRDKIRVMLWAVRKGEAGRLHMPQFAKGGFTTGPSIAGEAGTEAVISFQSGVRQQNIDIWKMAGKMLGATNNDDAGDDPPQIVFAPNITFSSDMDPAEARRKVEELYRLFEEFMERWWKKHRRVAYGK